MEEWKNLIGNDGVDLGERSKIQKEKAEQFHANADSFATELDYFYKNYQRLKKMFKSFGYDVEELKESVRVWRRVGTEGED